MTNKIFKKNMIFRSRIISGKIIYFGNNKGFELNETAHDIIKLFDGKKTIEEIYTDFLEKYNTTETKSKNDFLEVIKSFISNRFILEI